MNRDLKEGRGLLSRLSEEEVSDKVPEVAAFLTCSEQHGAQSGWSREGSWQ